LRLTRGHDITEAFEVHHLNEAKVNTILKTMYVRDASPSYVGRYQWDDAGFYRTVKRKVMAHFNPKTSKRVRRSTSNVSASLPSPCTSCRLPR